MPAMDRGEEAYSGEDPRSILTFMSIMSNDQQGDAKTLPRAFWAASAGLLAGSQSHLSDCRPTMPPTTMYGVILGASRYPFVIPMGS